MRNAVCRLSGEARGTGCPTYIIVSALLGSRWVGEQLSRSRVTFRTASQSE